MANLFKNLPHLLGTITNLDGAQSMRALASNAEIHRLSLVRGGLPAGQGRYGDRGSYDLSDQ